MSRLGTYSLLFVAWVSISSSAVLVVASGEAAFVCALWRLLLSLIFLVPLALVLEGRGSGGLNRKLVLTSLLAGVSLGFHFLVWMRSLFMISVASSTSLVVTYPLMVAVFECFFLKVRPALKEFAGLGLAFLGVLLVLRPNLGREVGSVGASLALLGAFLASIYFILGKVSREGLGIFTYASLTYSSAAASLLIYGFITGERFLPSRPGSWSYLLALALIPMMGGHTVMNYLLKRLPAYLVSSVALGEPGGASVLAAAFLAQFPNPLVVAGMSLTVLGEWLVLRERGGVLG